MSDTQEHASDHDDPQGKPGASEAAPHGTISDEHHQQQQGAGAGDGTPEDTLKAYESLLEQQKAQISGLLEQQRSLQEQMAVLIRNGASPSRPHDDGIGLDPEPYVPLANLGTQIGRRDYSSHNARRE